jgi:hypothetical protein
VYTNAQVAGIVAQMGAKIDALTSLVDALLVEFEASSPLAKMGYPTIATPAGAVTVAAAAQPITIPAKNAKAARYACSLHAEHKDGKGFSANGIAYHRANGCAGVTTTL